jgi:hypothetical protein
MRPGGSRQSFHARFAVTRLISAPCGILATAIGHQVGALQLLVIPRARQDAQILSRVFIRRSKK